MYEIQRRKGRLLTASSLALAVILTTGAGSAWAQGITTIPDGGTVSGHFDTGPIIIYGAPGTTATANLGGDTRTSVLGAYGGVDTIQVTGTHTLTLFGNGGNLIENADAKSAINLAIGPGTTVEVNGQGGAVGEVSSTGTNSYFNVVGQAGDNTVVSGKKMLNLAFRFDSATVNFEDIENALGAIDDHTTLKVKNSMIAASARHIQVYNHSVLNVGQDIVNYDIYAGTEYWGSPAGTVGSSTINIGGSAKSTLNMGLLLNAENKSTINVAEDVLNYNLLADNGSTLTVGGNVQNTLGSLLSLKSNNDSTIAVKGNISGSGAGSEWDILIGKNSTISVAGDISNLRNWQVGENSATQFDIIKSTPITGNGTTSQALIDDTAPLYIAHTRVEETTILSDFDGGIFDYNTATKTKTGLAPGAQVAGWHDNLSFDTRLFDPTEAIVRVNGAGDSVILDTRDAYRGAGKAYADGRISRGTADMIDSLYRGRANDVDSGNAGIRFVSRAVNENYLDQVNGGKQNNGQKVVTTIEGAAALASTAGVQTSTYSISNTLAANYNARLSYLRDTAPAAGSGEAGTIGVWINPFYNSTDIDGVRIGRHSTEYEFNYGGGAIGLDSNISDNFRLGLAFSAGGGDTESKGRNFNKTESDFDFWGLGVYGSYTNGLFGLTGDISYSRTSYDIDQRLPGALGLNKLTAEVDTDAFTGGLTAEYRFLTSNNLNIIPHLGLRYTNLKTDSYRVKEKGVGHVFSVSSEKQNIWTIPLGLTFTGEVAASSDWVIQPKADLGVIFAAGDLDADSKFRINGPNYGGRLTAEDVVDAVTFNGLVGLRAENCNGFSVGLDYNFKASDNLTSHGVTGTIRYDF